MFGTVAEENGKVTSSIRFRNGYDIQSRASSCPLYLYTKASSAKCNLSILVAVDSEGYKSHFAELAL